VPVGVKVPGRSFTVTSQHVLSSCHSIVLLIARPIKILSTKFESVAFHANHHHVPKQVAILFAIGGRQEAKCSSSWKF